MLFKPRLGDRAGKDLIRIINSILDILYLYCLICRSFKIVAVRLLVKGVHTSHHPYPIPPTFRSWQRGLCVTRSEIFIIVKNIFGFSLASDLGKLRQNTHYACVDVGSVRRGGVRLHSRLIKCGFMGLGVLEINFLYLTVVCLSELHWRRN